MDCYDMHDIIADKNDILYVGQVENLLRMQNLKFDKNAQYTAAVVIDNKIIATGSMIWLVLKSWFPKQYIIFLHLKKQKYYSEN